MPYEPPPYTEYDTKASAPAPPYSKQEYCSYQNVTQSPYPIQTQNGVPYSTVTVVQQFREVPCRIVCQFCNKECITKIKYKAGTLTWVSCLIITLIMPLGCGVIPFCIKSCKDPVHFCPNCNNIVGRYNRM